MSRKVLDTYPVIEIAVAMAGTATPADAVDVANELIRLIETHISPHARDIIGISRHERRPLDITRRIEEDARCEHCNSTWTEKSTTYNGGCCDPDEEANPKAEQVAA